MTHSGSQRGARRGPIVLAILTVVATSLLVYWLTLAPEVGWSDSAELALRAHQLGVTHPPGYPLHTLLGKLFMLLVGEPAVGTNLLSAVSASLAAGVLTWLVFQLTADAASGLVGGLTFALASPIWDVATVTEVYTLAVLTLGLALSLLVAWHAKPSVPRLVGAAAVYGLSLGSHLANLLLVPAFLVLLWQGRDHRLKRALTFLVIAAAVGGLLLSWGLIRARALPPLGTTYVPDTLGDALRFLTGSQYETTRLNPLSFYAERAVAQARTFGRAVFWIGLPIALLGVLDLCGGQHRPSPPPPTKAPGGEPPLSPPRGEYKGGFERRAVCLALLIIFALNALYFTGYAATDYGTMMGPAYFALALWIGCGVHALSRGAQRLAERFARPLGLASIAAGSGIVLLALASDRLGLGQDAGFGPTQVLLVIAGCTAAVGGIVLRRLRSPAWLARLGAAIVVSAVALAIPRTMLIEEFTDRYTKVQRQDVTYYAYVSFDVFPENAVVFVAWDKFTPLLYFQTVHGLRPDVTLVERTLGDEPMPRTYDFGVVEDWRAYLNAVVGTRPIVVDTKPVGLSPAYTYGVIPHGWHLVLPPGSTDPSETP